MHLSEKEFEFVDNVALGMPVSAAAQMAGYASNSIGSRLINRPQVQAAIETRVEHLLKVQKRALLGPRKYVRKCCQRQTVA